jgi:hypothetical protein
MQFRGPRLWLALAAAGALIALVAVAGSMRTLEFSILEQLGAPTRSAPVNLDVTEVSAARDRLFVGGALLLIGSVIAVALVAASLRRRKPGASSSGLRGLAAILLLSILFISLMRPNSGLWPTQIAEETAPPPAGALPTPAPTAEPAAEAAPPGAMVYGLSLGAAVLLAIGAAWIIGRLRRPPRAPAVEPPLPQLAQTAQAALDALRQGGSWQNAVIRCYEEMSRVVAESQGLVRQSSMTPREFARELDRVGVPGSPLERLTALFEKARYGALAPSEVDEAEAQGCLAALAEFFRRDAEAKEHAA